MKKPTLLVLAAGMGSRYGKLKQLDPVGPMGEVILDYSVYDAIRAGFGKVIFVIRREFEEEFKNAIGPKFKDKIEVEYVFQELEKLPDGFSAPEGRVKPWGTAHAVMMAKDNIHEPFAIINADDFYGRESFQIMADNLLKAGDVADDGSDDGADESITAGSVTAGTAPATPLETYFMVGYPLNKTLSDFGSVSRGISEVDEDGLLQKITERTHIEKTSFGARYKDGDDFYDLTGNEIVSMNFFGFTSSFLRHCENMFKDFLLENKDNLKAEFYVPFVANKLVDEGRVKLKVLTSNTEWFGITYLEDKPIVEQKIRDLVAEGLYPEGLWTV